MTFYDLSQKITKLSQRIEDLQQHCVGDPENGAEVLYDALRELQLNLEELSAIDKELHRQNEELTKAYKALRESEEKCRTAIDFTRDCETWFSPEGNYIYVSPSCERITGYSIDDFLKDPRLFEKIVHPDDCELYPRHFHKRDDEVLPVDFRIIDRNGEERWISHVCQPVYDSDGRYLGRRASNRDITAQKRAEKALMETTDYFKNLIDYASTPSIVWDSYFRISRFNHAFERLTGLKATEALNKPLDIIFPERSKEESLAYIKRTLSGERWEDVEIPIQRTDGSIRTVLWNSANIYDKDGTAVVATIAQGQDITERKLVEEELKKARDGLELRVQEGLLNSRMPWRQQKSLPGPNQLSLPICLTSFARP